MHNGLSDYLFYSSRKTTTLMNIQQKTIIITGASDGIGKAIALRLAKENTKLALIARDINKLNLVADEAKKLGATETKIYSCDISNTDALTKTCKDIINDFQSIDVLINNAGVWQKQMPVDELSQETIDTVIQTNLSALIHLTRLLLPQLRQAPEAAIINVVSKSGVLAQAGQSVYTASKYGVRGFTDVLKQDLQDTPIKVAGIYQSGTKTQMFAKADETVNTDNLTLPEDLANVIAFMLQQPKNIWLHDVRVGR